MFIEKKALSIHWFTTQVDVKILVFGRLEFRCATTLYMYSGGIADPKGN